MRTLDAFVLVAAFALASCEARETTPPVTESISERTPIAIDGVGPIKIGMSIEEAERALGGTLQIAAADAGSECQYARLASGPSALAFMLTKGVVARIDVRDSTMIQTAAGVHVGSHEAGIALAYPGRVTVTPHKYEAAGHTMTVTDPARPNERYVFETDGNSVTRYRAGRVPEVEFVEGCG
ncbi:MAG: hypothetical protein EXR00_05950 [Alphaproteobacteria bacterium]|nr:hypothetical protein [Alphaproteobacteria bacterium]